MNTDDEIALQKLAEEQRWFIAQHVNLADGDAIAVATCDNCNAVISASNSMETLRNVSQCPECRGKHLRVRRVRFTAVFQCDPFETA